MLNIEIVDQEMVDEQAAIPVDLVVRGRSKFVIVQPMLGRLEHHFSEQGG